MLTFPGEVSSAHLRARDPIFVILGFPRTSSSFLLMPTIDNSAFSPCRAGPKNTVSDERRVFPKRILGL